MLFFFLKKSIEFDDLTLPCEMQEDSYQVISRYRSGLRSDIQRTMSIHSHKIKTLEQASQPAQDRETSLRFSSVRRVIPKIGEQPNLNTHTTRDPKSETVIGEPSRNTKGSQYFKCQCYDHVAAQCPSRNLLVRRADDDEIETVVYELIGSVTDSDDDTRVSSI